MHANVFRRLLRRRSKAGRSGEDRLWAGAEALRPLDLPPQDVGAPLPHVLADDTRLVVAYRVSEPDPDWDGTYVNLVDADDEALCAVIVAKTYHALRFGPPNDEALRGHRLYSLGLRPYAAFEVENSAWIAEMEAANRVHSAHDAGRFRTRRHILFTFHDQMLEIVARELIVETRRGLLLDLARAAFPAL